MSTRLVYVLGERGEEVVGVAVVEPRRRPLVIVVAQRAAEWR